MVRGGARRGADPERRGRRRVKNLDRPPRTARRCLSFAHDGSRAACCPPPAPRAGARHTPRAGVVSDGRPGRPRRGRRRQRPDAGPDAPPAARRHRARRRERPRVLRGPGGGARRAGPGRADGRLPAGPDLPPAQPARLAEGHLPRRRRHDASATTAWGPEVAGDHPAWDPAGNGPTFTDSEKAAIQDIWQRVAEDYAPFDVDVTTQDPGEAAIHRSGPADQVFGTRALITPSDRAWDAICGRGCGGIAYLGVFDDDFDHAAYQPAWIFTSGLLDTPKVIAEAVSHEVGHNFGLSHDGSSSCDYYEGHEPWAPIMGAGYSQPITQWSKGDYADASNTRGRPRGHRQPRDAAAHRRGGRHRRHGGSAACRVRRHHQPDGQGRLRPRDLLGLGLPDRLTGAGQPRPGPEAAAAERLRCPGRGGQPDGGPRRRRRRERARCDHHPAVAGVRQLLPRGRRHRPGQPRRRLRRLRQPRLVHARRERLHAAGRGGAWTGRLARCHRHRGRHDPPGLDPAGHRRRQPADRLHHLPCRRRRHRGGRRHRRPGR